MKVTTREEQIRLIAYQIWEEEGRPHGKHMEHWSQAERRWNQDSGAGTTMTGSGSPSARPAAASGGASSPGAGGPGAKRVPRAAAKAPEEKRGQARSPRTRRPEK
ncbi:MAG: DUF2934 domain-containing protein [Chloroflexi bacterium]|nr:DUF2934 domain-containing protein [Chloroflexota bacterium]